MTRPDRYGRSVSLQQVGDLRPPRPLLRGWLHEVAFVCAIPASVFLLVVARGTTARLAVGVYGFGICALYGVSAAYHRGKWSAAGRARMKRLDHGTIFVMIAATYTPVCLVLPGNGLGVPLLIGAWIAAAAGMALALTGLAERPYIGFACYLGFGWVALLGLPAVIRTGDGFDLAMFVGGGLVYTLGAGVLASRWPNPSPRIFGYHEVWHTFVIAASACHYLLILSLLRSA